MSLRPRTKDQVVSDPLVLEKRIVRNYDRGDGEINHMIEELLEIAEDFLRVNDKEDVNNLTNYGCFMTVNQRLEDLPEAERDKLIAEADLKHRNVLMKKLFEADGWADDSTTRRWITDMHRQAALFLGEEKGRPWVTTRGSAPDKPKTKECPECGFDMKIGAFKCPNCKAIVDKALEKAYRERQKAE
jgi:hypothetical protein